MHNYQYAVCFKCGEIFHPMLISRDPRVKMFNKMLDELPDDTLLTAVDCHI